MTIDKSEKYGIWVSRWSWLANASHGLFADNDLGTSLSAQIVTEAIMARLTQSSDGNRAIAARL